MRTVKMPAEVCKLVLLTEGLEGWTVEYSKGGGKVIWSTKTIYADSWAMFLHEVAHILLDHHDNTHDVHFADLLTALADRYMEPNLTPFSLAPLGLGEGAKAPSQDKGTATKEKS